MILTRENILNFVITAGLILVPIYAVIVEEPFTITLATRAVIFSLAAVEQLGACGASILHNLSSSVNLKKGEVVSKVCPGCSKIGPKLTQSRRFRLAHSVR